MSVTTTANPTHYTLAATLADYDLHHTTEGGHDASLNAHANPAANAQQNPSHWPTQHRRVPAYRPVNTQLDESERRVYLNGIEQAFVGTMFTGVFLQSAMSKIWRNSLGRVWNVGYKLGGEW
ncbi:hypothetical protein GGP41_010698 [Bipolaris sorokiniana]|uniref:Uncharacterized protein n=2 Tax=Cochliobolus sativus TaxID=45130 RepID=A0A8H6DYB4_COCSA|nr:uncharacterized protein COCSADRAFT_140355 [Bipolaris sorokiniana ND90Pr]EMD65924.1 hypothetical protein COCSADRAFT_140355 [Bipolaris sorokiniana ND90Pr]KAF5851040.1 hypothetical protein GGP41_010698 [Bipolaris sorokiniana]